MTDAPTPTLSYQPVTSRERRQSRYGIASLLFALAVWILMVRVVYLVVMVHPFTWWMLEVSIHVILLPAAFLGALVTGLVGILQRRRARGCAVAGLLMGPPPLFIAALVLLTA